MTLRGFATTLVMYFCVVMFCSSANAELDMGQGAAMCSNSGGAGSNQLSVDHVYHTAGDLPSSLTQPTVLKRKRALYVSPQEAAKLQKAQGAVLVDVSPEQDFTQRSIPGSLNIPPYSLQYRRFLKDKIIILVNAGAGASMLEKLAQNLTSQGFRDVRILEGGLAAWRRAGLPVRGEYFAWEGVSIIPCQLFFTDRKYDDWKIISVGKDNIKMANSLFPRGVQVRISSAGQGKTAVELERVLEKIKRENKHAFVLMVTGDGNYETIRPTVEKSGLLNVFYLQGGMTGYFDFLKIQAYAMNHEDRKVTTGKPCGCRQ